MLTVNCAGTLPGEVKVADVSVELNVPGFAGAPVPGVKIQVTPAFVLSAGTEAVIVTTVLGPTLLELTFRTTLLKFAGALVQPASCKQATTIIKHDESHSPARFAMPLPPIKPPQCRMRC